MPLEKSEWKRQVGCWMSDPVKWKDSRHRGGSVDNRVGSEEASLQRPSIGPRWSTPLFHPVYEGWLPSIGWLASGEPLEGHWCDVFRVCTDSKGVNCLCVSGRNVILFEALSGGGLPLGSEWVQNHSRGWCRLHRTSIAGSPTQILVSTISYITGSDM